MLAKNESIASQTTNSAVNAPVRSRSRIIADQMKPLPARPVAAAPALPAKPRMTLADFQARQSAAMSAAEAVSEQIEAGGDEVLAVTGMSEADVLRKLAELEHCSIEAKKLYEKRDLLEAELLEVLRPGDIIKLVDGRTAYVIDNFAEDKIDKKTGRRANKVWRVAGVSRFDIEFTKAGK